MTTIGQKQALITGSNRGIGLELCAQLAARGDHVFAACREPSEALAKLSEDSDGGVTILSGVDVTQEAGLASLVEGLGEQRLDLLINNAGVLRRSGLTALDLESIRWQFEVNSLAPLRVTAALLSNLGAGSKVAIITSRMGSMADNTSGGAYGYRMSKAAVNMAGKSLAVDLAPRKIAVALLHPGWVRTDMTANNGLIDVDESARGLIERIDALTLETSGGFWHTNGDALPW